MTVLTLLLRNSAYTEVCHANKQASKAKGSMYMYCSSFRKRRGGNGNSTCFIWSPFFVLLLALCPCHHSPLFHSSFFLAFSLFCILLSPPPNSIEFEYVSRAYCICSSR